MKYDQQIAPVACSLLPEPHKHALPLPIHPSIHMLSVHCVGAGMPLYIPVNIYTNCRDSIAVEIIHFAIEKKNTFKKFLLYSSITLRWSAYLPSITSGNTIN